MIFCAEAALLAQGNDEDRKMRNAHMERPQFNSRRHKKDRKNAELKLGGKKPPAKRRMT